MPSAIGRPVFICHASKDAGTARQICTYLESERIACWIAPRDVAPEANYAEEIIGGIERAAVVLLVLSTGANQSRHVRNEIERAVSKGKIILPLRVEDVLPGGALELHVASSQWVDAYVPPLETGLVRAAVAIKALLGQSECNRDSVTSASVPQTAARAVAVNGGQGGDHMTATAAVVSGNHVSVRQQPSVAAKVLRHLDLGDEVVVIAKTTVCHDRECQLKDDLMFRPEKGKPYRLRAGKGLIISGEQGDAYRIEVRRWRGVDVGYVAKSAVVLMDAATWCKVRTGKVEGWVLARYVRTF